MSDPRFAELLENYWCAAYTQGQDHREVDDEAGTAQDAEHALHQYVNDLTRELAEARDKALEDAARLVDENDYRIYSPGEVADAIRALKEKP